ncbi:histidine kinase [Novimethylophilus kurashikiensis]|uniref:histidine kinase n=1 Tax=Novimethylophilus kurashikiensis TaxID=1825523 RepID=A0A2R5F904_9PROT|nr:PAS domain S-box protein [Novimethylophilus kurashikiensis]GBG14720.1 histidine kinase [Novimethylophilus kurashikiensis]
MIRRLDHLSFHALFNIAADALLLVDAEGKILVSNPSAQAFLGYSPEEMQHMCVEQLIPERLRDRHVHYRQHYLAKPEKRTMGQGADLLALARDGRELPVDIGLSPIMVEGERYVLITFIDALERRRAQAALRESEERLRLAKRAAGLGVFDRDLLRDTVTLDARAREILGLEEDAVVTPEQLMAQVHPEDDALRRSALKQAMNPHGTGEYYLEYRNSQSSAPERWVAASGQVFFEDDEPVRIVGTLQDITERKAMKQAFRDHQADIDAALKRQAASQTASAMAHELNQPLAALSAYSEVALHELEKTACSDQLKRALQGCIEQSHRAGRTLHELLEYLHEGEPGLEAIDLNVLVRETLTLARAEGLIQFNSVLEPYLHLPLVQGNRLQLQKVIANLIRNGLEAMRDAGVENPTITIRTSQKGNKAMVTVQDSGPGFHPDTATRIFEPFFTTKSRGMGMGLSISRALVEAGGGLLWADPEAGPGATFHFTLPLAS